MNTIPPNDSGHYEMLDALVQLEPAEAMDTELAGQFVAIGIVEDEKFAPDERLRRILDEAAITGNAASRTIAMARTRPRASATTTGDAFDGAKTYRPRLPKDIPAVRF